MTPPAESPSMRNFWNRINRITTGRLTSKLAAAKSPQDWPVDEIIDARPTGNVYISFEVLNVNANKNSFHAARNENNAVTAIAGSDRGRMIFAKISNLLHPSNKAASSNSRGTVSKNP